MHTSCMIWQSTSNINTTTVIKTTSNVYDTWKNITGEKMPAIVWQWSAFEVCDLVQHYLGHSLRQEQLNRHPMTNLWEHEAKKPHRSYRQK